MGKRKKKGKLYIFSDCSNVSLFRETNLKIRQGLPETSDLLTPEAVSQLKGVIKSEQPNNSLYTYEGTLRFKTKELALDPLQLLLRVKKKIEVHLNNV